MSKSKFFDAEKKEIASRLEQMINTVMLAYWGQATPQRFAKAWNYACRIIDEYKAGERITYTKLYDALEWLVEASKDDSKIAKMLAI